jgi:diaminohydroxyphosphoribosylaminopyrimidine deaminase / 5-amino-6-(5-phosphoribosylamino)uracil reductase
MATNSSDRSFMEAAIDQMKLSPAGKEHPRVGAVLVVNNEIVGHGYRRDVSDSSSSKKSFHAEQDAIQQAINNDRKPTGGVIYTTLEPCVPLRSQREACSELICRMGISSVVIGQYDPNPKIYKLGWSMLSDRGVVLRDFDSDLREEVHHLNQSFESNFLFGFGPRGRRSFDYNQGDGRFEFGFCEGDERRIVTEWALLGKDAVQVHASPPTQTRFFEYAKEFAKIDDPTAGDLKERRVHIGTSSSSRVGVVAFIQPDWCVLVRVLNVKSGLHYGGDDPTKSVEIDWQVRAL